MHLITEPRPDIISLFAAFEECHPEELRWTPQYKKKYLKGKGNFGYWLANEEDEVIGEALLHHKSDSCVEIDGYTILPQHQGKGHGNTLLDLTCVEMKKKNYRYMTGEARSGASVAAFERLGAEIVCPQDNWGETGETYFSFKLNL